MNAPTEYRFLDSATQDVSQTLLIGLGGPTGAGKTESGIRLAKGIAEARGGEFCVIDTENRRALNKKKRYQFKHLDLQAPYSPANYEGAIRAAIQAGYKAVFVDSFSHEWDGEGGLQDQHDEILERMAKGDPEKMERLNALAWKKPKQDHKKLMIYLRKCEVPIIFGLRAEPKVKFLKVDKDGRPVAKDAPGKMQIVDAGWLPIAEKMFGYDMLIYALMMAENPGIPVHLKKLEQEFEPMFPAGQQITEECGRQLAAWARGGSSRPVSQGDTNTTLSEAQVRVITERCTGAGVPVVRLLSLVSKTYQKAVTDVGQILASDYEEVLGLIDRLKGKK